MWTEEQRRIYRPEGHPSDPQDVEWTRLAPLILPTLPSGQVRKTEMRAAMEAILYLLRPGCRDAICRARAFRRARPSTTSSQVLVLWRLGGDLDRWRLQRLAG
jgi:hypothetical protein